MAPHFLNRAFLLTLTTLVLTAGCPVDEYKVDLKPDGDGLHRQLQVRRVDDGKEHSFDEKKLAAIAKAYDVPPPKETTRVPPFVRTFVDRMPNDVGGAGRYLRLPSQLGTASMYVERFRGTIDAVARVEEKNSEIDRWVNHLVAWLKTEIGSEPYAEKALAVADVEVRRDLKNLVLYTLAGNLPVGDNNESQATLVRMGAFVVERGYCQPQDVPALARAFGDLQRDHGVRLTEFVLRMLATKAGLPLDQPLPERLQRLTQPEVLKTSQRKYGETTSEHHAQIAKWEETKQKQPDAQRPDAADVLQLDLIEFSLSGSDNLSVTLHTPVAPHETNGKWSSEKKAITWSQSIPAQSSDTWPVLCYAFWAEPDVKYQEARFGQMLLKDQELAEYCTWYAGLSAEERREWDALLTSEPAGEALLQRIEQFRFRHDHPAEATPNVAKGEKDNPQALSSLADKPRSLFKSARERQHQQPKEKPRAEK